jgi:hypothetical protein
MKAKLFATVLSAALIASCGPPQLEQFKEIKPNETAFVISLEGNKSDQAKFDSSEAVKNLRVSTRRIPIPLRQKSLGRAPWNYEWIPVVQIITVDRSPVTREWAQSNTTERDANAIYVESKESIAFSLAVTITCSIKEEEAHEFLYWYGGKPLSEVVDKNMRSVVAAEMAKRFGKMSLNDCREKKGDVFEEIRQVVSDEFSSKGITIMSFGNSGGLFYENEEVQATMNREFIAQNELRIQEFQLKADEVKRQNSFAESENERKKAEEFAKAQNAAEAKVKLQIMQEMATKWKGDVPNFLILGSGDNVPQFLMQLDKEIK